MTDCPRGEIRDLLPDLLHDRLQGAVHAEVVAHVAVCESCSDELRLLRTARAALVRSSSVNAERVLQGMRAAPMPRRRALPAWPMRIAASLVLLFSGVLAIALLGDRGSSGPQGTVAVGTERSASADLVVTADAGLFVGSLADLDDAELEAMLGTLQTLELLPAEEPMPLVHGFEMSEG